MSRNYGLNMTHLTSEMSEVVPPIILSLLTFVIFIILAKKRRDTQVNALDWIISIFGFTFLLGLAQIMKIFLHDDISFFDAAVEDTALGTDIPRVIHLLVLIFLYLMAEQFLGDNLHSFRLIFISSLVSIYTYLTIYYVTTDTVVYTDEILEFAQNTSFDEFIFDFIQLFAVGLIFYIYTIQYFVTEDKRFKRFLLIIVIAVIIFLITAFLEILEHFIDMEPINAFLTAIPTFLLLAYFYIRYPNFVYLAPTKIAFLQIVTEHGNMLYAAELKEELDTSDYLVGPSLTSVNYIVEELVSSDDQVVELKKFVYNGGTILFEKVGNIRAILQTDRPARILKRSMRYFLREFNRLYSDQILDFKGYIKATTDGVSPDDLFRRCIPIVASKAITSSFGKSS
ncbi:MAG: hypothetical protein ACXAD7_00590 [Candidatus Kariarchaeaceae archaeon]|jgi:hypothetical protein